MNTLKTIEFTTEEKTIVSSIINTFGSGQHPMCNEKNIGGFYCSYLKKILTGKKFNKEELSDDKKQLVDSIKTKLFLTIVADKVQ